ncbi:hypothetical protein [Streptomyces alboniger]|uniref:Uncharacterized protein n=1 Tax=Streptomyces alboniger TaxID=132473 RepID=A0A5J6HPB7_STRAD|nr:hypothetical protein [Streptomyces alboniger]QEV22159.1 hypothetical protein CP975_07250 [Streptomyces alboniger]
MRTAQTAQAADASHPPRPRTAHPVLWAALAALAGGAVLCVLGWYGVSGERFAERQLPYLASCTVPGAALIVAGAVLLTHGRSALAAARVEELYGLLVAAEPAMSPERLRAPVASSDELLTVPGGTLWHRADCPLAADRPEAAPADAVILARGTLAPCPICEPPRPATPSEPPTTGPPTAPEPAPER